jgi:hypothetical protein
MVKGGSGLLNSGPYPDNGADTTSKSALVCQNDNALYGHFLLVPLCYETKNDHENIMLYKKSFLRAPLKIPFPLHPAAKSHLRRYPSST